MSAVKGVFMILLLMVVGANLIQPVNTAVSVIVTPTYSASVVSLSALLPLVFVIIQLLRSFDSV